jgi:hypothetical protein
MRQIRISKQVMLATLWLSIPTEARASVHLFERASTCVANTYTQCAGIQASLPPAFCCPPTSTCLPLAGNTTLLCCPTGNDCSTIQTIPCDISLQNSTAHPDNILKTTELTVPLSQCNGQCCPFGFTCDGTNCVRNKDQNSVPSAATSTSTTIVPTTSFKPATSTTENSTVNAQCDKFPVPTVLVGFFPGLVLGVLLTIASVFLLGAHRRSSDRRRSGSSFGNISEPQLSSDIRTDFLRKPPQTPSSTADSSRLTGVQRVRSLFRKSNYPNGSKNTGLPGSPRPAPPIPLMAQNQQSRPVTPVLQREPSYEDINIFADGDTASALREREHHGNGEGLASGKLDDRNSHQTTFTDMMERSGLAGLQKGQRESSYPLSRFIWAVTNLQTAYVYKGNSPGYSPPPRTRDV